MKNLDDLNKIIAEVFEMTPSEINLAMSPKDIKNWDSLAQLNLITAIEKEFSIVFEVDEIFSIYTIGDIFSLLKKRGLIANSDE
tara:strand:+ start:218 stop:469 length:252 start_codon:yes stop_codon:yes gene_type:complete